MDTTFTTTFGDTYEPFLITEYEARTSADDCLVVMHRDNTRGSVLILYYDRADIGLYEIGASSDQLEVQSFIEGTDYYTHMTVVNKSGGTGNEKYWLITNIDMNFRSKSITLTANQITFHDMTGGSNTAFDWITRTNMVITDDSGMYLAYGTTGRGFAYKQSDPSLNNKCIAMNADTPLSTLTYRIVYNSEYN